MFEATFQAELARRVGERVEIATDTNLIDGVLTGVSANLVIAVQTSGYGPGETVFIALEAINFVRFPAAA